MSQLQKSADAISRAISNEFPKLNPVERRELLTQVIKWLSGRLTAFDEAAKRAKTQIVAPTPVETQITALPFGKGSRTSDTM